MEEVKQERDFEQEVRELYEDRPELRGEELPEDVIRAVVKGKNLSEAYADYDHRKKEEKKAADTAKAPVKGVTHGGSVSTQPEDAFLRGFSSAW